MTNAELALIANFILVLITGVYAYFTFRILKANQDVANEMAAQRHDLRRPIVSIYPEFDEFLVASLIIKNSGLSPATNLNLKIDKDFFQFAERVDGKNLRSFSAFNNEIAALASGSEIRFDLAEGFNLGEKDECGEIAPIKFSVEAKYEFLSTKFEEVTVVDLQPFFQATVRRSKKLTEVEKIRKALEKLASKN